MSRQVDIKALVSHIVRGDGSDRCRICMGDTSEGQVHLEDTVMMDGDKPVTLAELLEVITGVEVEHTSPLPNKLCLRCSRDLTSIIPFIKRCKESAKRWNQITDYLYTLVPSNKAKNVYIEIGNDIEMYTDTSRCLVSKMTTKKEALQGFKYRLRRQTIYKSRLVQHETAGQEVTAKGKPIMSCPNCAAQFQCLFRFNKHVREFRKKVCRVCFEIVDIPAFVEHCNGHNMTLISCPICLESFERDYALRAHTLKHEKGPEECLECHETFANSGHLNKHMNIKHKPIVCGCGKKLPNRICFLKHKQICVKHRDISSVFICDYCKVEYTRKKSLNLHIKLKHTVGRAFQCDKCGKQLSNRSHLIEHGTTHEKITDRYVCHCGAKYSSRRGYERHMKKHAEGKEMRDSKGKIKSNTALIKTEKTEV